MIKQQTTLFFTALQFYTRLPIPKWVEYKPENLSLATRFLPFVGCLVGLVAGMAWVSAGYLTSTDIGLVLSMIVSILTTGGFHEDGFADVCDGFGGGWTKTKILEIMKDSRVGTYGAVGLILILGLKFCLLQYLAVLVHGEICLLILILTSAHAISRFMPALVIFTQAYARDTDDSKSKPVAEVASTATILVAGFFAITPLFLLCLISNQFFSAFSVGFLLLITFFLSRYFNRWIGGYTGDCLGAIQQICEVGFYLFLAVLWKFI